MCQNENDCLNGIIQDSIEELKTETSSLNYELGVASDLIDINTDGIDFNTNGIKNVNLTLQSKIDDMNMTLLDEMLSLENLFSY